MRSYIIGSRHVGEVTGQRTACRWNFSGDGLHLRRSDEIGLVARDQQWSWVMVYRRKC